ncbi:acyl carrier protein [Microbispora sp. RL4-1S]|uniref:Acyl carrier protein n=1 Tax=Microbispora oryzae TaxID=2806554 RepID=A0A940WHK4_9ACTN|nr:acyl carrier protein [Microbispora oryzae]MBP2705859.1 acyl carrier protein [Microbispora oryzae]
MIEQTIHEIWGRELKLSDFSDHDDFFALGGHSLIMTEIQKAIAEKLGVEVPMDELFRQNTVHKISTHIGSLLAVS